MRRTALCLLLLTCLTLTGQTFKDQYGLFGDNNLSDYSFSFRARNPKDAEQVQIWAGFRHANRYDRYVVGLKGGLLDQVYLMRLGYMGTDEFLGERPLRFHPVPGEWYRMKVEVVGQRIRVFVGDETLPYIDVIDVSGQKWFPPGGPNYGSRWTWMSLMRLAIPRLLPEERRVLYLDCDTIVRQDIGELFDLDLGGCLLAAVLEPDKSRDGRRYYNAGVLLMDLDALRASGKVAEMVSAANYRRWGLPDQDVLNACCSRQTLALDPAYNATGFIPHDEERVKIRHYAGTRDKMAEAELQEALRLPWCDWGAGA